MSFEMVGVREKTPLEGRLVDALSASPFRIGGEFVKGGFGSEPLVCRGLGDPPRVAPLGDGHLMEKNLPVHKLFLDGGVGQRAGQTILPRLDPLVLPVQPGRAALTAFGSYGPRTKFIPRSVQSFRRIIVFHFFEFRAAHGLD